MIDLYDDVAECHFYDNGHRFLYDPELSRAELSIFSCLCGKLLHEAEDSGTGA